MEPGAVVAQRYRLESVALKGGMGSVFRATDLTTETACAVKLLRAEGGSQSELEKRFAREVRAIQELRHPAVVRYLADGIDEGVPYLVMEWVEGNNLRDELRRRQPTFDEAFATISRLVSALIALHRAGIVHRDIKPPNLMLPNGEFEAVRIVDFGIAHLPPREITGRLTFTGLRLGTPGYMAPEQILQSKTVDARADVFSLGCVAFELLTGERTYAGDDLIAILARVVIEDAPNVRERRPEIPVEIASLVARMLARNPRDRPAADEALLAEVDALRERFRILRLPPPPPPPSGPRAPEATRTEVMEIDPPTVHSVAEGTPSEVSGELVGRDAELALVDEVAQSGRITCVFGVAGVGKSRLLREAARRLRERGNPVVHADVRNARDAASVARIVAQRLNVSREGAIVAAIRAHGPLVLVIDGIDLAGDDLGELLERWRERAPDATWLVGAREKPSWVSSAIALEPLKSSAADLLAARARAAGAVLTKDDETVISSLAEQLEGNPLSIELTANRLAEVSARELQAVFEAARTEAEKLDPLSLAWNALGHGEQAALVRVAFFEGDFHEDDAAILLGAADAPALLRSLRERALLATGSFASTLVVPTVIRDFVRGEANDIDPAAKARHASYVVDLCEDLARRIERGTDVSAFARAAMRTDDLLAIAEGDDLLAARAVAALDPVIVGRVPLTAHHALLARAIAICDEAQAENRAARLSRARGRVAALMGRLDDAFAELTHALAYARGTQDLEGEASALMELAVVHHMRGDVEAGARCCRGVLELRDRLDAPRIEARAVGNLGGLAHDAGDPDEAYARYVEAIALAEAAPDERMLGVFLANLAMLDADRNHPSVARSRLYRSISLLRRAGEDRLVAIALANLGMVELELSNAKAARSNLEQASKTLADVGDTRSEALARMRLAAAHALLGDPTRSAASVEAARALAKTDERTLAVIDVFEAFVWLARGKAEPARAHRDRAIALPTAHGRTLAASSDDARAALRVLARYLT